MLPQNYSGLVADQNPAAIAAAILKVLAEESGEQMRAHFTAHFTLERHLVDLAAAIRSVE
jgi:glycosyltransferase involved in cell wall biosynthesis